MSNKEITQLKTNMAVVNEKLGNIEKSLAKNDEQHKIIISKIDTFIQSAGDRFVAKKDHQEIVGRFKDLSEHIDDTYVTKDTFGPVRAIAFGLVGVILTAVAGALLLLVLR